MILYFSATGNSKYCAERLALKTNSELVSINELMKQHITEVDVQESNLLGFVCPTYDFDMAYAVAEFIDGLVIKGLQKDCYVFAVFTCGKSCGTAEKTMQNILIKKGIQLNAAYKIEMPDNYIPMFPLVSKEEQGKILEKAEVTLKDIVDSVVSRNNAKITTPQMPVFMKFVIGKVAVPNQRKATKNFWVTNDCIGCGLCESVCPKNIILVKNEKPTWTKDDCACCLSCIHRCPKQAIQYGKKTVKTGRYTNPNVEL